MAGLYEHGPYSVTEDTQLAAAPTVTALAQVIVGTAPVHLTADPLSAVNKPVICYSLAECREKLGYSDEFDKYTLCQSMYASFVMYHTAPVVFINVLDPSRHCTAVSVKDYAVNNGAVTISDDVIVSTLVIKNGTAEISKDKYETEWIDGSLVISFADSVTGTVSISYDKVDPSKVTRNDIIGSWDTETDVRTGAELIKNVHPMFGVIPSLLLAPGWSKDDTVGGVLAQKTSKINGNFSAMAILDIDTAIARTRAAAIAAKQSRTLNDSCIVTYPLVKKDGKVLSYSAVLGALIMVQAAGTEGITCSSPSNQSLDIDDVVLGDGTSVFYDTLNGNELNKYGIVTAIARNGWYTWGNNTAAYPDTEDPVKRWIVTHLSFDYIGNDFINSNFSNIDRNIDTKIIENAVSDYNIKLASWSNSGYIIRGSVSYSAEDNDKESLMRGHFTVRTSIGGNTPAEVIKNVLSYDVNALADMLSGGEG